MMFYAAVRTRQHDLSHLGRDERIQQHVTLYTNNKLNTNGGRKNVQLIGQSVVSDYRRIRSSL